MEQFDLIIIGAGISGLSVLEEIKDTGLRVGVIERSQIIGGNALNLSCKATDRCLRCNYCLVISCLKDLTLNNSIDISLGTEVKRIKREKDYFILNAERQSLVIRADLCDGCGRCYEVCPGRDDGAIRRSPHPLVSPPFYIDTERCICDKESKDRICEKECEKGAIVFLPNSQRILFRAKAILLSTGFVPFDPEHIKRFNFSKCPNMITQTELDQMLKLKGGVHRISDGRVPQNMAFIQCVGSRNPKIDKEYCSRVCCGYTLRSVLKISHIHPEMEISVFYMDIQELGKEDEQLLDQLPQRVRYIRSMPGDMYPSEGDNILIRYYDERENRVVSHIFEMVSLSVGMCGREENFPLFEELNIRPDQDGFLDTDGKDSEGIFICGSCRGPMDVSECVLDAKVVAHDIKRFFNKV